MTNSNENPTTTEVRAFLKSNDWTDEEVDNLFGYHFRMVNQDGTTTISRDQWTRLAEDF